MDTNNINDRLKLYELALADYEASLGASSNYKFALKTQFGFCHYFYKNHNLGLVYRHFEQVLPELHLMKPQGRELRITWFYDGAIQPRIDCLKRAIELTKQKITDEANI